MTRFRIELETYHGPLDLLLYLVRKHELDATDLPIAPIADQYLQYIAVLEQIDVDAVGDFLEMASALIEIKSRMVLPGEQEVEDEIVDHRQELVRRLLAYKQFRDAASMLEERCREWQQRYPRLASDLPAPSRSPVDQPIQEVELWDLVSAFGRVLKEKFAAPGPENIRYDDTPIHVYMSQINKQLTEQGRLTLRALFRPGMHKSAVIGMFLAILELVRHQQVRADQNQLFGEIWILPGPRPGGELDPASVDSYEHGGEKEG